MVQAALVSRAVKRPVKLIWSREEDVQHDIYRPAVSHRLTAGLDRAGRLQVMEHKVVSPSILQFVYPAGVTDTFDPSCCEGLEETHYQIPNWRADFKLLKVGVPTSVLRTTGYGPNIFGIECFIDELAERANRDPLEYRRELLAGQTRALAVLDLVAHRARWDEPPPPGRTRGLAFCEAFKTVIAQVVEVSVTGNLVRVHRVVTALDAGEVLDPDITSNSIEGGIAWGLSAALKSQITFERGRAVQSNFHDFEVLRIHEMPECDVHVINSGARPLGGVGEVGPVTVVPALVNAVSRAIGRRLRSVPLSLHGFRAS
jgi:isoquinoline 1-oxidoreductase subunit beta